MEDPHMLPLMREEAPECVLCGFSLYNDYIVIDFGKICSSATICTRCNKFRCDIIEGLCCDCYLEVYNGFPLINHIKYKCSRSGHYTINNNLMVAFIKLKRCSLSADNSIIDEYECSLYVCNKESFRFDINVSRNKIINLVNLGAQNVNKYYTYEQIYKIYFEYVHLWW